MARARSFVSRAALVFLLVCFASADARGRLWKTVTGQSFEAEFVRVEGTNGIFTVKEKEYPYPLNRLSISDRLLIGRIVNQQPSVPQIARGPALGAGKVQLAGQVLKANGENELLIPVSDPAELRELRKAYGKPSDRARLLIALPNDFAPAEKSYPLLIVSTSADGPASNIGAAHQYVRDALGKGFAVLAVDGQFGKPPNDDSTDFRWALVSAALAALDKEWPLAKDWPIATAGFSGGGGYASHQALKLAQKHANLIGIFLAVSPWNPTNFGADFKVVTFSAIRDLPIFLSAAENDKITEPKSTEKSYRSLLSKGFSKVRCEHFSGGHELNHQHLETALDWFSAQAKTK